MLEVNNLFHATRIIEGLAQRVDHVCNKICEQ